MNIQRWTIMVGLVAGIPVAGCSDSGGSTGGPGDATTGNEPNDIGVMRPPPDMGFSDAADAGFYDGGPADDGGPDGGMPPVTVRPRFEGACQPDFGGRLVVSFDGDFMSVSSLIGDQLQAVLQLDLDGARGAEIISTKRREETGLTINLIAGATWTNFSSDPDVLAGTAVDPIEGTLQVETYQPALGVTRLTFEGVVLQHSSDASLCTVNGQLWTDRLGE